MFGLDDATMVLSVSPHVSSSWAIVTLLKSLYSLSPSNALLVKAHQRRPFRICQLCLSFYPHPNISDTFPSDFIFVGDKINTSQSTQKGKRDELNPFKYFTQVTGAQIFAKHQFQRSNLDFTMKPASLSSAIQSFFSRHGIYLHPTKDRCSTRPTSPFLYICCNFGQFSCTNVIYFFSV